MGPAGSKGAIPTLSQNAGTEGEMMKALASEATLVEYRCMQSLLGWTDGRGSMCFTPFSLSRVSLCSLLYNKDYKYFNLDYCV